MNLTQWLIAAAALCNALWAAHTGVNPWVVALAGASAGITLTLALVGARLRRGAA